MNFLGIEPGKVGSIAGWASWLGRRIFSLPHASHEAPGGGKNIAMICADRPEGRRTAHKSARATSFGAEETSMMLASRRQRCTGCGLPCLRALPRSASDLATSHIVYPECHLELTGE